MITVLLLPHLRIHGHLRLLIVLNTIPCTVDPLFHPLLFYQSHLCPPFLLLMHILQANMERGQALLQVNREHEQILLGCHTSLLRLIHLMVPGCRVIPVAGSFLPLYHVS
ncbi:unnamed protein product [Urochloa humidicola]